jgi:Tol biopolymer transport system component
VTETLAAVLKNEPDWSLLPVATPLHVRVLLNRCLQKDPKQRLRDIGDARISLDEILAGASKAAPDPRVPLSASRLLLPWAIASVAMLAALALAFIHFREKPSAPTESMRFHIPLSNKASFAGGLALSPDGRHLALVALAQDGRAQLWARDLDSVVSRPLPGTEDISGPPFWSPDSRALAFEAGGKLQRVDLSGGAPQLICNAPSALGGTWNQGGVIVFGTYTGLMKVAASGGSPSLLLKADRSRGEFSLRHPLFLPDGRHFLYAGGRSSSPGVYLGSLDAKGEQPPSKPLLAGLLADYAAPRSGPGHIFLMEPDKTLVAQLFDARRAELEGEPSVIAHGVRDFTVSANGVLAYVEGDATPLQLTWFDRHGKILGTVGEPGIIPLPAISPNGTAVAIPRVDVAGGTDLWLYDLARGTSSRLTFDGKQNGFPVWSPDGRRIAFRSTRHGTPAIYQKAINGIGDEVPLDEARNGVRTPFDWSRDGRYLIEGRTGSMSSIWVLLLSPEQAGGAREPVYYLSDGFDARLSPNGQWIAYVSDETGRDEIFVQTFPKRQGKWLVSTNGGKSPVWSRDGKDLYFIGLDRSLMEVAVKSGPSGDFEAGAAKILFNSRSGPARTDRFDIAKDGRFLIPTVTGQSGGSITIIVNWPSLLKQ